MLLSGNTIPNIYGFNWHIQVPISITPKFEHVEEGEHLLDESKFKASESDQFQITSVPRMCPHPGHGLGKEIIFKKGHGIPCHPGTSAGRVVCCQLGRFRATIRQFPYKKWLIL